MKRYTVKPNSRQASRGLNTNSKQWKAIRRQVLMEQPLCPYCEVLGQIIAATEVDHRDNDSHNNSRENLVGMCVQHHAQKSAVEAQGKTWQFRAVGADGWPIDAGAVDAILAKYTEG